MSFILILTSSFLETLVRKFQACLFTSSRILIFILRLGWITRGTLFQKKINHSVLRHLREEFVFLMIRLPSTIIQTTWATRDCSQLVRTWVSSHVCILTMVFLMA